MKPGRWIDEGAITLVAIAGLCFPGAQGTAVEEEPPVWDLSSAMLAEAPDHRWIDETSPIRSLFYAGLPYQDRDTEVFAFYASPATLGLDPSGKDHQYPAVVLIHGGGGTAFAEWVWLWAQRGYAAIAMDLGGHRPPAPQFDKDGQLKLPDLGNKREARVRLENGGPGQGHPEKFASIGGTHTDDWPWHAVSNAIRAHSLIRSFPEVDPDRTAVTGISWGGYTTCLVASIDSRFKAAVPVYGCGFLFEGESVQKKSIDALDPELRAEWIRRYDPSSHLAKCRVPIFFVNGSHDIHYPLDSYQKCYDLVPGEKHIRIEPRMRHGHSPGWAPKEIARFIDGHCGESKPLAVPTDPRKTPDGNNLAITIANQVPIARATLHYTIETGLRVERQWQSVEAMIDRSEIIFSAPPAETNTWFLTITDKEGDMVSTPVYFPEAENN